MNTIYSKAASLLDEGFKTPAARKAFFASIKRNVHYLKSVPMGGPSGGKSKEEKSKETTYRKKEVSNLVSRKGATVSVKSHQDSDGGPEGHTFQLKSVAKAKKLMSKVGKMDLYSAKLKKRVPSSKLKKLLGHQAWDKPAAGITKGVAR